MKEKKIPKEEIITSLNKAVLEVDKILNDKRNVQRGEEKSCKHQFAYWKDSLKLKWCPDCKSYV